MLPSHRHQPIKQDNQWCPWKCHCHGDQTHFAGVLSLVLTMQMGVKLSSIYFFSYNMPVVLILSAMLWWIIDMVVKNLQEWPSIAAWKPLSARARCWGLVGVCKGTPADKGRCLWFLDAHPFRASFPLVTLQEGGGFSAMSCCHLCYCCKYSLRGWSWRTSSMKIAVHTLWLFILECM